MDKKQIGKTIILIALMLLMVRFWVPLTDWVGSRLGYDMTRRPPEATTQVAPPSTTEQSAQSSEPTTQHGVRVAPATMPMMARLGSAEPNDPNYRMAVIISPRGAGLESVVLNPFKQTVRDKDLYTFQRPFVDYEDMSRSLATRSITIDGNEIDMTKADWDLESSSGDSATYATTVATDSGPAVRIHKTFRVLPKSDPSQGYELAVTQQFENLTDKDVKVRTSFNGASPPLREQDRGGERSVLSGYDVKGDIVVRHDAIESFTKDKPSLDLTKDKDGNGIAWSGFSSSFFNAIVRPISDNPQTPAKFLQNVTATSINPNLEAVDHEIIMTFATTELSIPSHKAIEVPLRAFFGPRQRNVLGSEYYASFPAAYHQTLVLTSGICAVCTFDWLIRALVGLLAGFHFIFRDWGLAIIGLVVLVRVILHPVTKKSQISMAKMGKMGPEMERLRKKHGDNKDELSKAMWELQKEQGIGPYLGCLPMFLQMPIWIALWQSLQTTFELRHAEFLWGLTWIHDLSKPDHLIEFSHIINVRFLPTISGLNILPILMGVVFWLQMKFQPKPVTMTKEQEQQQKMMAFLMPVMFPLMLYSGPSGLNLYIMTSTLIGIVEAKIVRDHIKQREEEEKAGRIIVDAGKKFKGNKKDKDGGASRSNLDRPKSGFMGWIAQLQQKADDLRREAERRKK